MNALRLLLPFPALQMILFGNAVDSMYTTQHGKQPVSLSLFLAFLQRQPRRQQEQDEVSDDAGPAGQPVRPAGRIRCICGGRQAVQVQGGVLRRMTTQQVRRQCCIAQASNMP